MIGDADSGEDGYVTINEMLEDTPVKSPLCPLCKKPLVKEDKVLHSRGQRYVTLFSCKKDGPMLLTLRLHRNFNDTWRAKRTINKATEEEIADYRRRLEEANVKRKPRSRRPNKKRPRRRPVDAAKS